MDIPRDRFLYQDELALYWMDNAILCSIVKPVPRTVEMVIKSFELIKEITMAEKVCLLSDTSLSGPCLEGARETSENLIKDHFKAMALVSYGPYGKLLVNAFIAISNQPIPMQLFISEKKGRAWLKQYV